MNFMILFSILLATSLNSQISGAENAILAPSLSSQISGVDRQAGKNEALLYTIPSDSPIIHDDEVVYPGLPPLTINPEIQRGLTDFLIKQNLPIAAVVLADSVTGEILAMVQGRQPKEWQSEVHSALHPRFPAASLFKVIPTIAALEIAGLDPDHNLGLMGGCANVTPRGQWLTDAKPSKYSDMSLRKAFAHSCNTFFAKLTIQSLGMGTLVQYTEKFRWGRTFPADFKTEISPIVYPSPEDSSIETVGRFAAGFGMVGLSPVHAAWVYMTIARGGNMIPLRLFKQSQALPIPQEKIIDVNTGTKLRDIMRSTILGGTARGVFSRKPYRMIREQVAGKTGTLNGESPLGLTTWFAGFMPYDDPKVVVSAVVVNSERWHIKGPHLAAEALRLWNLYGHGKFVMSQKK